MGYSRRRKSDSYEFAQRHMAEAREFSSEMGGYDKDVKEYFFNLPPRQLDQLLTEYGRKFGSKPEEYARKTFISWRKGKRGMSGLVAKRLFDLLPPKMPLDKKFELAENLWRHFAPVTVHEYTISQDTDINELAIVIQERLDSTITLHTIPPLIKNRFVWLAAGDIKTEERILNYFRQREKGLIMARLHLEIPLLQNQLAKHPEITSSLKSEFRINNNRILVTLIDKDKNPPQNHPDKPLPSPANPDISGYLRLLAAIVVILLIFLLLRHK